MAPRRKKTDDKTADGQGADRTPLSFAPHPLRGAVLAEVHARPFHAVATPRRLLRFAFMTDFAQAAADRAALATFCAARGVAGPMGGEKHCLVTLGDAVLRWEQHSEFTTYTFEIGGLDRIPFERPASTLAYVMREIPQPGPHLVSVDLHLVAAMPEGGLEALFDSASLAASALADGAAFAATDFRVSGDGFVRLLVVNKNLNALGAGALTQRLMEIETYRTLALLGLPEAQRLAPSVKRVEDQLTAIARSMTESEGLEANHQLLTELMRLAAELEAESTTSGYRFSASRAYDGIVQQRLEALGEGRIANLSTFGSFMARRLAPAMRTCEMMEARQASLAEKLSRTANLLRTRVYVDMEEQNRELMRSMNDRTRLQLRMQQTVEGLSVAAVSYYVLGLLGYLFKGAKEAHWLPLDPNIATALALPLVVAGVAFAVRRIRKAHSEPH